jgi:hypothetical protein
LLDSRQCRDGRPWQASGLRSPAWSGDEGLSELTEQELLALAIALEEEDMGIIQRRIGATFRFALPPQAENAA